MHFKDTKQYASLLGTSLKGRRRAEANEQNGPSSSFRCVRARAERECFLLRVHLFLRPSAALRNCGGTCRSIFKGCCVVVAPAEVILVLICDKVLVGSFFSGFLAFLRCDDLQLFPLFFAGFPFVISTSIAPTHTRGDKRKSGAPLQRGRKTCHLHKALYLCRL